MDAESQCLLEVLACQAQCLNLSDLRLPGILPRLLTLLEGLQPGDFPLGEWNGAVGYLLRKPLYFPTGEAARQYLLHHLT